MEDESFAGWGCSECAWVFKPSDAPGKSFDEMIRTFELQRYKEFSLHVCADHRRPKRKKPQ
jgi:hypothetical protein